MRVLLLLILTLAPLSALAQDQVPVGDLPAALVARMEADPECHRFDELANGADIAVDRAFDGDRQLFILPCWSAAYNFGWKVFVEIFEGEYEQAAFAEYAPETGWTATTYLVNYWYDPATRTLGSFYKGRGLGDCGTSGEWQWRDYHFVLVRFASKRECGADIPGEDDEVGPGEFPIVYTEETGPVPPVPAPAATGAAAPARPIGELPAALIARHAGEAADCDAFEDLPNGDEAYAEPLGEGRTLYLLPCISGAYRFFHRAWLGEGEAFTPLWFAGLTYAAGWQAEPGVWLDRFEPATLRLFAADLGTGMGNCGSTGIWQWTGSAFAMVEYRMQPDCNDTTGAPGVFPVVFRAAN